MTPEEQQIFANIDRINGAQAAGEGMDIVIVSTTSVAQEEYWQNRLTASRGQIIPEAASVTAVHEDWPDGAGNGLGTLYAVRKAAVKLRELDDIDLFERMAGGAAVALYHTAGKGTRLAPLPGSENNNKPGVKLPALVTINGVTVPITILEAVIKQTAIYAAGRRGRLSVFWGDQIFIPAASPDYKARHHADILAKLGRMPSESEWSANAYDTYGLVAVDGGGHAVQVEKISYDTAARLIAKGVLSADGGIGVSLGSFSMSVVMMEALLDEFWNELNARTGKLDSDPHFWMPMTLDAETYRDIMATKGTDQESADRHFRRMTAFTEKLTAAHPEVGLFGAVNVGVESCWWDYGQVPFYMNNNLMMTAEGIEADAVRHFFQCDERRGACELGAELDVDSASCILGSTLGVGRIRRSLVLGTFLGQVDIEDSVLINVTAPAVTARSCLLYNLAESQELRIVEGTVRADAFIPGSGRHTMQTQLRSDGGKDWFTALPGNDLSYADLHRLNMEVNTLEAEGMAQAEHRRIREGMDIAF